MLQNSLKNEFDITEAPQEIAGFFICIYNEKLSMQRQTHHIRFSDDHNKQLLSIGHVYGKKYQRPRCQRT